MMTSIAHQRIHNQHLSSTAFKKPADLVNWMGALQAQDYYGAKWALAQRMKDATDETIEKAFANGDILRTHVMRPTWHFVTPADIRWLLKLTAPRVNAACSHNYRKFELDASVFKRSNKALASALRNGGQLTRDTLRTAVERAGIAADNLRFIHILIRAELDAVICSGARKGKQFTYALLDERAPQTKTLTRDEALAELAQRYFTSHGPATLQDFTWWSGLTVADASSGLDLVQRQLAKEAIDGKTYWLPSSAPVIKPASRAVFLLPTYDEYLVAYKDRSAALDSKQAMPGNVVFSSAIVIDGRVVGSWKRTFKNSSVLITFSPFAPFKKADKLAVYDAAHRYATFLGLKPEFA
jgi:Winged helix DNA-binding domain